MIHISDYIILHGELYHHGVLGQKWGVRRYQNKDGSLTSAGKKHYSTGEVKGKPTESKGGILKRFSKSKKQATAAPVKKELTPEEKEAKKKSVLESRSAAELYKNANLFDDNELKSAYNRLIQEDNIKKLIPATKTKVDKFIDKTKKISAMADEVSKAAENGIKVYNVIAKTSNSLFGTNMKEVMDVTKRNDEKRKYEKHQLELEKTKLERDKAKREFDNTEVKPNSNNQNQNGSNKSNKSNKSNTSNKPKVKGSPTGVKATKWVVKKASKPKTMADYEQAVEEAFKETHRSSNKVPWYDPSTGVTVNDTWTRRKKGVNYNA